jgi:hypothetical protein
MSGAARAAAAQRIGRVATELAEINDRLVFIGGAVLPLLVDVEARFDAPRVTKDVDAVAATATYTAKHRIEQAMRKARYRDARDSHIGRFISPTNEILDISFAGDHAGGTGSLTDALAIETAVLAPGPPEFRHLSATGLFLMKVDAFFDRGSAAPYASKDLADLGVLLVGCPTLTDEVAARSGEIRRQVAQSAIRLHGAHDVEEALRSHFRDRRPIPPDAPDSLAREALGYLDSLAHLAARSADEG